MEQVSSKELGLATWTHIFCLPIVDAYGPCKHFIMEQKQFWAAGRKFFNGVVNAAKLGKLFVRHCIMVGQSNSHKAKPVSNNEFKHSQCHVRHRLMPRRLNPATDTGMRRRHPEPRVRTLQVAVSKYNQAMKTTLLFVFAVTASTLARTNLNVSTNHLVVTTNYVAAHPDFRRVNGQLYNTRYSTNWFDFRGEVVHATQNRLVIKNSKFLRRATNSLPAGTPRSHLPADYDQYAVLTNYSAPVTTGQRINGAAMRIGQINYGNLTVELWDCGTPNLGPVLVTNAPATQKPGKNKVISN